MIVFCVPHILLAFHFVFESFFTGVKFVELLSGLADVGMSLTALYPVVQHVETISYV